MIVATLYPAQGNPVEYSLAELGLQNAKGGLKPSVEQVATVLGCIPGLVDILVSGDGCIAFSIFDYEGATNQAAMEALAQATGERFDTSDADQVIQGPVLLIRKG